MPNAQPVSIAPGVKAVLPVPPPSPVVVSVPHAAVATGDFAATLAASLDPRCDADLHVDALYEGLAPGAMVVATHSRFVCDLNRHPDDVSARAVPEHPAPRNADGRGFVWELTTVGRPTLVRALTLGEWRARCDLHAAYHATLAEALARAREAFGHAVLVDGHSMPSRGAAGHADAGRLRAEIVPGDRDGASCAPALSDLVDAHFRARGFSVARNDPYRGGYITQRHGRPADRVHAIQIEVRRDLYMDESAYDLRPAGFARLRAALAELLRAVHTFAPGPPA